MWTGKHGAGFISPFPFQRERGRGCCWRFALKGLHLRNLFSDWLLPIGYSPFSNSVLFSLDLPHYIKFSLVLFGCQRNILLLGRKLGRVLSSLHNFFPTFSWIGKKKKLYNTEDYFSRVLALEQIWRKHSTKSIRPTFQCHFPTFLAKSCLSQSLLRESTWKIKGTGLLCPVQID